MTKFEPRKLMELAVKEMRKSIAEPRDDGKVPPKVGAVLINAADHGSSGQTISAFRGELREGDHAEFTLLERKNRDRALDDCVLFATLEPCAPGARSHPKLGCAERIVLARIKRVWIGIEDPDPTVDRKGIKFLQESGVEVKMFERDLQEIIREENKAFLDQALERKEEVENEKIVTLSTLEASQTAVDWGSLSNEALDIYRSRAGITDELESERFRQLLLRQGLMVLEEGQIVPTGFGNVLFGSNPRESTPQAAVLATIHFADGTEESRDFDGPQSMVPELVMKWLRDKMPNVLIRSEAVRQEKNEAIFTLIREGLVNAIVHRDYEITQAKCQLVVHSDRIEINSPGEPVSPITLDQLQSFSAPMLSRNPVVHFVFSRLHLAEERGLGLKSLRLVAEEGDLPLPRYSWNPPYLVLTIFLSEEGVVSVIPDGIAEELSKGELAGWKWLSRVGTATSGEYADSLQLERRSARRHLNRFAELGLVEKIGAGPSTSYKVK